MITQAWRLLCMAEFGQQDGAPVNEKRAFPFREKLLRQDENGTLPAAWMRAFVSGAAASNYQVQLRFCSMKVLTCSGFTSPKSRWPSFR